MRLFEGPTLYSRKRWEAVSDHGDRCYLAQEYLYLILYLSISVSDFLQLSPSPPLSISISISHPSLHFHLHHPIISPSLRISFSISITFAIFSRNKDGAESLRSAFCEIYVHKIYKAKTCFKKIKLHAQWTSNLDRRGLRPLPKYRQSFLLPLFSLDVTFKYF